MVELSGEVERISFRNDSNGWSVIRLRTDDYRQVVTVVGSFVSIDSGEYLRLFGDWIEHKTYGKQFRSLRQVPPNTVTGIERYLSSRRIKGIGKITAKKIVDHFGLETLAILDTNPSRLQEIESIGKKKTNTIIDAWNENKVTRDLELFLVSQGLTPALAIRVINQYGRDTVAKVMDNPYRLALDIRGIGFLSADKIAMNLGLAEDSDERVKAAVIYQLQEGEDDGHCYLMTKQLLEKLVDCLKLEENVLLAKLGKVLLELNHARHVTSEKISLGEVDTTIHFQNDLLQAEEDLAEKIRLMLAKSFYVDKERITGWLKRYCEILHNALSESQLKAIEGAVSSRVYVLTGGPGVGKTTTANVIIRLLKAMGRQVALAAPTGRAAQRLSELTGYEAKTIHRLLEWNAEEFGFKRDGINQLTAQAVVIDEASMLDVRLAKSLMQAIPSSAQIIFIGDVDQLPSVGPGNVLRDLIDSKIVPFTRLTQIFRQAASSLIISAAHSINQGVYPVFSDEPESDCRFIEAESPDSIKCVMRDLLMDILPNVCNFDPVREVQILTPMNLGDLGTSVLNSELQELLNPGSKDVHELKQSFLVLRRGDKVIQTANNYQLGVFNGDIGYVLEAGVDGGKVLVNFFDRQITYAGEDLHELKLAYAITIHKSQGSEFPVVLIPIAMQHFIMLQRNLIYTALTRSRKLAIFIGSRKALHYAVKNQTSKERQTRLVARLIESM